MLFQSAIPCPAKLLIKDESRIKTFSDNEGLKYLLLCILSQVVTITCAQLK
jgi:hypothetical protein